MGMRLGWCQKLLHPLIPLGWALPSMPGRGKYKRRIDGASSCDLGVYLSDQLFFLLNCRYVIECPNCGVVYRSRQYWFGNQDPVDTVVRTEIVHVWPGVSLFAWVGFLSF